MSLDDLNVALRTSPLVALSSVPLQVSVRDDDSLIGARGCAKTTAHFLVERSYFQGFVEYRRGLASPPPFERTGVVVPIDVFVRPAGPDLTLHAHAYAGSMCMGGALQLLSDQSAPCKLVQAAAEAGGGGAFLTASIVESTHAPGRVQVPIGAFESLFDDPSTTHVLLHMPSWVEYDLVVHEKKPGVTTIVQVSFDEPQVTRVTRAPE